MNKIAKKQMAKAIVTEETKKSKPAGLALQEQERDVVWAVLILLTANEMNREEAASFLHGWIEKEGALWHELGLRQGHAIAEGLTKQKPPHRAIRKIVRVLMENPKATTEEIFRALTKAHIPLYKSKSMPDAEDWQDVIKVPYLSRAE